MSSLLKKLRADRSDDDDDDERLQVSFARVLTCNCNPKCASLAPETDRSATRIFYCCARARDETSAQNDDRSLGQSVAGRRLIRNGRNATQRCAEANCVT